MTLDTFVTNETGKKHLIPGQAEIYRGQCVQLIGIYLLDVFNQTLPAHPNAKDYWAYGIPDWVKVTAPQDGDIAIYRGHDVYPEGHIAIVYHGEVFEENADPDGAPAHLFSRSSTYLLGYLRKEGTSVTNQELHDLGTAVYRTCLHREPESGAAAISMGQRFVSNGTISPESAQKAVYTVFNSPEWKGQDAKLKAAPMPPTPATQLKPGLYKV